MLGMGWLEKPQGAQGSCDCLVCLCFYTLCISSIIHYMVKGFVLCLNPVNVLCPGFTYFSWGVVGIAGTDLPLAAVGFGVLQVLGCSGFPGGCRAPGTPRCRWMPGHCGLANATLETWGLTEQSFAPADFPNRPVFSCVLFWGGLCQWCWNTGVTEEIKNLSLELDKWELQELEEHAVGETVIQLCFYVYLLSVMKGWLLALNLGKAYCKA